MENLVENGYFDMLGSYLHKATSRDIYTSTRYNSSHIYAVVDLGAPRKRRGSAERDSHWVCAKRFLIGWVGVLTLHCAGKVPAVGGKGGLMCWGHGEDKKLECSNLLYKIDDEP